MFTCFKLDKVHVYISTSLQLYTARRSTLRISPECRTGTRQGRFSRWLDSVSRFLATTSPSSDIKYVL